MKRGHRPLTSFLAEIRGTPVEEWLNKPERVKQAATISMHADFHRCFFWYCGIL